MSLPKSVPKTLRAKCLPKPADNSRSRAVKLSTGMQHSSYNAFTYRNCNGECDELHIFASAVDANGACNSNPPSLLDGYLYSTPGSVGMRRAIRIHPCRKDMHKSQHCGNSACPHRAIGVWRSSLLSASHYLLRRYKRSPLTVRR
jgi:hypothetical protein